MATTKKATNKNKKSNNTEKIIRNYDIFSMEKRVYNMDHTPRRSYDIYTLEKRIHDLEVNGGGGSATILSGMGDPSSDIGENGQIYLSCTGIDLTDFTVKKESSMTISKNVIKIVNTYVGGDSIGCQSYISMDLTNINKISIDIHGYGASYDNYTSLRFSPIFIIENTVDPSSSYVANTVTQSATGETYNIEHVGDSEHFDIDVSALTGTYYLVFSSSGSTSDFYNLVIDDSATLIFNASVKVNDSWTNIIGANINDINL